MPLNDVTICVTSFLRPGYLKECLRGIHENLPECRVQVVDDSGRDIDTTPCDGCVFLPFDSGLPAKRNAGVTICSTKYWVPGHDDFDFSTQEAREGLLKLVKVLDENPDVDVAGGRVHNDPYEGFLEWVPGSHIKETWLKTDGTKEFYPVDLTVNYFLARTDRIVPWDERMKIGGEHGDWFLEMKEQGRKTVWVPGVNITTLQLGPEAQDERYPAFRGRARELGHKIFKEKRNIVDYIGFDGCKS